MLFEHPFQIGNFDARVLHFALQLIEGKEGGTLAMETFLPFPSTVSDIPTLLRRNPLSLSCRYFLTDTVLEDVIFGWPKHSGGLPLRQQLASRLQTAIHSVRMPDLLLLDEPLAGLGDPNSFHSDLHEASQALQQWHEG
ncbi:uncharacterized protein LOC18426045 isoform X8 [Amborella trichopoda]|uniref:uncharacterized protein LOC18426045 isoform X8 n=1 Tax=Amborella trichopoda TaxID=13333 RepID=UPI0009C144A9|nr:uncharacterized protein LOC18426045 isoform X8 [Amborella trichopoda]|eukprot:XP_020517935.1 uncharacterized protein LOC18426045 isoform X8 [Amborella trichopoda]